MTLTETNSTSAETRLMSARARRDKAGSFIVASSLGLLEVDDHRVRVEEERNHRGKEHRVAQVDDAAHDGVEMRQKAHAGDGVDQSLRCAALEEPKRDAGTAYDEEERDRRGHHEGDYLVLGESRDRRAHRQERARHQEAADIAREDHAVVGTAEVVDGDP